MASVSCEQTINELDRETLVQKELIALLTHLEHLEELMVLKLFNLNPHVVVKGCNHRVGRGRRTVNLKITKRLCLNANTHTHTVKS